MSAADVLQLVYLATAVVLIVFLFRFGKATRTYLTDYMRGLRFVRGAFANVLGPGGYKPLTRRVHVEVVDMRPVPFLLESISCRDALQNESVVSIGAELLVDDPYLAATSLKSRVSDSLTFVRDALRVVLSRAISHGNPEFRAKVGQDVENTANEQLRRVGMQISRVEVTEVFSRSAPPRVTKGLN